MTNPINYTELLRTFESLPKEPDTQTIIPPCILNHMPYSGQTTASSRELKEVITTIVAHDSRLLLKKEAEKTSLVWENTKDFIIPQVIKNQRALIDVHESLKKFAKTEQNLLETRIQTWFTSSKALNSEKTKAKERILAFVKDPDAQTLDFSDLNLDSLPPVFDHSFFKTRQYQLLSPAFPYRKPFTGETILTTWIKNYPEAHTDMAVNKITAFINDETANSLDFSDLPDLTHLPSIFTLPPFSERLKQLKLADKALAYNSTLDLPLCLTSLQDRSGTYQQIEQKGRVKKRASPK